MTTGEVSALDTLRTRSHGDMEPWLAAGLSWLIPGAGQFYTRSWPRGLLFLGLAFALNAVLLVLLTAPALSLLWLPPLKIGSLILLPGIASFAAYRDAVRGNVRGFEENRRLAKDPWLAVFLSLILPGAGQAYLLKGWLAFIAVASFLFTYVLSGSPGALFATELIYLLGCVHAYAACQIHRRTWHRTMIFMALLIVTVSFSENVVFPRLYDRFVFVITWPRGPSMNPTLEKSDMIIISKYAYRIGSARVGDIIEFRPQEGILPDSSHVVKRIVAAGGETVQIRGGRILIDGMEREFGNLKNPGSQDPDAVAIEERGGEDNPFLAFAVDEPFRVPENHYFVLGDNLAYSADSRYFGPISRQSIEGRVVKIIWPLRRARNLR